MSPELTFQRVKRYFENRPAVIEAMSCLREGREVGFVIGGRWVGTLFRAGDRNFVEARPADAPDVTFHFSPEGILRVLANPGMDLGQLTFVFLTELAKGTVTVQVTPQGVGRIGSGYLSLMTLCGERLGWQFVKEGWKYLLESTSSLCATWKRSPPL